MDKHNNELGIALDRTAKTWSEVIAGARTVIDGSSRDGRGGAGQAHWLEESKWKKDPVHTLTKKPIKINWPWTDWVNGVQHEPYVYPFGGEEHRHLGDGDRRDEEIPLIDQGVEFWSPADVRSVMQSRAYLRSDAPQNRVVRAKVQAWFERVHGAGPAAVDATGRAIAGGPSLFRARSVGGLVHVSAHSREGGKVSVSAYDRSPPSR